MKQKFKNQRILIAGASQGIGRSISLTLAGKSAHLILVARKKKPLEELAGEIKKNHPDLSPETFTADFSSWAQVSSVFSKITRSNKKLDGVISNIGTSYPGYFSEIPIEKFEISMRMNYLSAVYCSRAACSHLNDHGFISFTSSVAGYMGVFGYSSYSGPKFALFGFAETLLQELAYRNIQISVLCPPDTETPGFDNENKTKPEETKKLSEGAKLMQPDKVAEIFLRKLSQKKFLITCNFESWLFFRLHGIFPALTRKVMVMLVRSYQKKKHGKNYPSQSYEN